MANLVIVRHGQSQWNKENRFTGWVDVDLAEKGIDEAREAGRKLQNMRFDHGFTSALKRAQRTLDIILEESAQKGVMVEKDEALNERMYGDLQGMNKDEAREKFGEDQVHLWRRSYDIPPPKGESLKDTAARVIPYFEKNIVPRLRDGEDIIVSAHGNSLRALVMHLEGLNEDEILQVEIPTGKPRLYELDGDLNVLFSGYIE